MTFKLFSDVMLFTEEVILVKFKNSALYMINYGREISPIEDDC